MLLVVVAVALYAPIERLGVANCGVLKAIQSFRTELCVDALRQAEVRVKSDRSAVRVTRTVAVAGTS